MRPPELSQALAGFKGMGLSAEAKSLMSLLSNKVPARAGGVGKWGGTMHTCTTQSLGNSCTPAEGWSLGH